jgi:hypothetical protein
VINAFRTSLTCSLSVRFWDSMISVSRLIAAMRSELRPVW